MDINVFIREHNLSNLASIENERVSSHDKLVFNTSCNRIFNSTVENVRIPKESNILAITEHNSRLVLTEIS